MIVFHGTTWRNAMYIYINGFIPIRPTKAVWFTKNKPYARRRARHKAHTADSRPIVLTCNLDLDALRQELGPNKVRVRNPQIISIAGPVPPSVLVSRTLLEISHEPKDLTRWINQLLRLNPYLSVKETDPGIVRLSQWIRDRLSSNPETKPTEQEVMQRASQWLPKHFEGFAGQAEAMMDPEEEDLDFSDVIEQETRKQEVQNRKRERAIDDLKSDKPKRRIRGLSRLSHLQDSELSNWCFRLIEDESVSVRAAALETLRQCETADTVLLTSFATSEDIHIRAAAVSTLTRHAGADVPNWFRTGLTDPSPHVRVHTARYLNDLDPVHHHAILELAHQDENPNIVRIAERCVDQDHKEPEKS